MLLRYTVLYNKLVLDLTLNLSIETTEMKKYLPTLFDIYIRLTKYNCWGYTLVYIILRHVGLPKMIVGSSGNATKTPMKKPLGLLLDKTRHLLPLLTSVVIALPTKINKTWQL